MANEFQILTDRINKLKKQLGYKQVKYSDSPLTGAVTCCNIIGVDKTTGTLYYKDEDGNWAEVPSGGGGSSYEPHNLQFKVDDTEMIAGETVLTITVNNGVSDLESISVDGQEIYSNLADRFSYTIIYNPTSIVITFNQGVISEQIFKIKYFTN